MRRALLVLVLVLSSCAVGRYLSGAGEVAAEASGPMLGATAGALAGGPLGAAVGAGIGFLVTIAIGQTNAQVEALDGAGATVNGFKKTQTTWLGIAPSAWLALVIAALIWKLAPWLPGWLYRWAKDVLDQRKNNGKPE